MRRRFVFTNIVVLAFVITGCSDGLLIVGSNTASAIGTLMTTTVQQILSALVTQAFTPTTSMPAGM